MKFAISEVFCEVISAIGFIVALLPALILFDVVDISSIQDSIRDVSGANVLSFLIAAYILGVFLNVLGLPFDRWLTKLGVTGQYPDASSSKLFFQKASSDLFNYRTNAWNHYYCFRNLLIFSPVALLL